MTVWFKVLLPHDNYRPGDLFSGLEDDPRMRARVRMGVVEQLELPVDSGVTRGKQGNRRQNPRKSVRNGTSDSVRGESSEPDRVVSESDGSGEEAERE